MKKFDFDGYLVKHTDTDINIWEEKSQDDTGLCRWMFSVANWLSPEFTELPQKVKVKICIETE